MENLKRQPYKKLWQIFCKKKSVVHSFPPARASFGVVGVFEHIFGVIVWGSVCICRVPVYLSLNASSRFKELIELFERKEINLVKRRSELFPFPLFLSLSPQSHFVPTFFAFRRWTEPNRTALNHSLWFIDAFLVRVSIDLFTYVVYLRTNLQCCGTVTVNGILKFFWR